MIEFFYNIWRGILENKDQILVFLTSGQFVALLGSFVAWRKTNKSTRENTQSTGDLKNALIANEKNCVDSETAANNTNDIKDLLLKVQDFVKDFETKIENTLASQTLKVDAMIEVQSIVYSTIKDEKVRNTVANVLTAAKYADTATRLELKREIEALKNEVKEKSHQLSECVKNASDRVEAIVDGERVKSEEVVVRY